MSLRKKRVLWVCLGLGAVVFVGSFFGQQKYDGFPLVEVVLDEKTRANLQGATYATISAWEGTRVDPKYRLKTHGRKASVKGDRICWDSWFGGTETLFFSSYQQEKGCDLLLEWKDGSSRIVTLTYPDFRKRMTVDSEDVARVILRLEECVLPSP